MAQSLDHLTLDFYSSYDPGVMGLNPAEGSALSVEPTQDSLSLPLPLLYFTCTLSQKEGRQAGREGRKKEKRKGNRLTLTPYLTIIFSDLIMLVNILFSLQLKATF